MNRRLGDRCHYRRGGGVRQTAAWAILLCASAAHGQDPSSWELSAIRIGAEIGITGTTRLIEDGSGISVRQRISPSVGLEARLPVTPAITAGLGVRAARTQLTVEQSGNRWSGGTSHSYDLALTVAHELPGMLVGRIGAVGSFVFGPRDLVPFRVHHGRITLWGSEVGLSRRLGRSPLHASLGGQLLRLGAQSREDAPVGGGWVGRVHLGLRYAR